VKKHLGGEEAKSKHCANSAGRRLRRIPIRQNEAEDASVQRSVKIFGNLNTTEEKITHSGQALNAHVKHAERSFLLSHIDSKLVEGAFALRNAEALHIQKTCKVEITHTGKEAMLRKSARCAGQHIL